MNRLLTKDKIPQCETLFLTQFCDRSQLLPLRHLFQRFFRYGKAKGFGGAAYDQLIQTYLPGFFPIRRLKCPGQALLPLSDCAKFRILLNKRIIQDSRLLPYVLRIFFFSATI